jgi:hypothetical protein
MLSFEPISTRHRDLFNAYAYAERGRISVQSFVGCYIWSHKYRHQLAEADGSLFVRCAAGERVLYFAPMGGDFRHGVELLLADAQTWAQPLRLRELTKAHADALEAAFPGRFHITESRDTADYLYRAADLRDLPGRPYHQKRNFVSRFQRENDCRWRYEPITEQSKPDVWAFQDQWCRKNDCASNESLRDEASAIALLLYGLDKLGAKGGLLRVDGKVVAFTLGSLISPGVLDVHVEKADYEVPGAYQMIHRQFLLSEWADAEWVNREEDMGLEGLRRAKLSYHPAEILLKYNADWRE